MRLKFIAQQMPTLVAKPPEGDGWIHEVKFDGYRSQMVIDKADVRIFTRRGLDWTPNRSLFHPFIEENTAPDAHRCRWRLYGCSPQALPREPERNDL